MNNILNLVISLLVKELNKESFTRKDTEYRIYKTPENHNSLLIQNELTHTNQTPTNTPSTPSHITHYSKPPEDININNTTENTTEHNRTDNNNDNTDKTANILFDLIDTTDTYNAIYTEQPEDYKNIITSKNENFKILNLNICSINKNFDQLCVFLERLQTNVDVIILTECWLNTKNYMHRLLKDYTLHCTTIHRYQNDGVIIYIKNGLEAHVEEIALSDANCLALTLANKYLIFAIYRSPAERNIHRFLKSLDLELTQRNKYEKIYLTGDLNINITEDTADDRESQYEEMLATHGLFPAYRLITRPKSGTCLDHFFIKSTDNIQHIIFKINITDHYPVICVTQTINSTQKKKMHKFLTVTDYKTVEEELKLIDWTVILSETDVNIACLNFTDKLKTIIENNTKRKKVPHKMNPIQPWITPSVIKCTHKRDKLHLELRADPENKDLESNYKKYRNMCKTVINAARNHYYSNKIKSNMHNSRKTWQTINEAADNVSKKTDPPLNIANINLYNQYFNEVGSKLAEVTLHRIGKTEEELLTNDQCLVRAPGTFFLFPTDHIEVKNIIRNLKNHTAPGWDGITSEILKKVLDQVIDPITHIMNLSLSSGVFPEIFKKGTIIPIFKNGNKEEIGNYRPITLLPTLSKVLEKIVKKRLLSYVQKHHLISNKQFGFQNNKSTEHAFDELTKYVTDNLDSGKRCIGVFLDLAKAFDTISIKLLLRKLEKIGIDGLAYRWFYSYLVGRTHSVRLQDISSSELTVKYGVPQGSVLGPILFLLYIDNLTNQSFVDYTISFADDTVLLFSAENWNELYTKANLGLNYVKSWLDNNLLTLNATKTKYISFAISSRTADPGTLSLKLHNCGNNVEQNCSCVNITAEKVVPYLGVLVDDRLTWDSHIRRLSGRVRKLMHVFKRIRGIMSFNLLLTVYYALCQSILYYGISAWGGTCKTHLIRLERSQRMVLKVMMNKNFQYSTEKLYKETRVLTVRQLYISNILQTLNISENETTSKRRPHIVHKKRLNTAFAQRHKSTRAVIIYNKISKSLNLNRICKSKRKTTLHKYLNNLNYTDTENLLEIIK